MSAENLVVTPLLSALDQDSNHLEENGRECDDTKYKTARIPAFVSDSYSDELQLANTDTWTSPDFGPTSSNPLLSSAPLYRVYKRRWLGVGIIGMLNFMSAFSVITYAPVADLTRQRFGLATLSPINWLYISAAFVYAVVSPFSFYITRMNTKTALVAGSVLLISGSWLRYLATRLQSYPCLLLGSILCGASQPFALNIPSHYSDLWFNENGRVTATALMSLANPLGQAAAALVVPSLAVDVSTISDMSLYIAILFTCTTCCSAITPARPPTKPSASAHEHKLEFKDALQKLMQSADFICILVPFAVLVAAFNAFATLTEQFVSPYGFSDVQAGVIGASMVLVGIVSGIVTAPVIDSTKAYKAPIMIAILATAGSYLGLVFAIGNYSTATFVAIIILAAIIGGSGLTILPVALELASDVSFPTPPELTSSILWPTGQVLGGILILITDNLRTKDSKYTRGLIFLAIVSFVPVPFMVALIRSQRIASSRLRRNVITSTDEPDHESA